MGGLTALTPKVTAFDQFFNLIHKNADGMLVVDEQGIMQFVNPAAEMLLGRSAQELLGETSLIDMYNMLSSHKLR